MRFSFHKTDAPYTIVVFSNDTGEPATAEQLDAILQALNAPHLGKEIADIAVAIIRHEGP